ncbi:hypothetical protein BG011_005033 [Mortierella polycephala]|uniref:Uncharacterized protein n=1 Tax=Mortierella polycephala TaxID=41804 RepID=A0A9P6PYB3_9FUNG|nr:hypothetical protein BG011_005033 [Mortierella polycephala]
MPGTSRPMKSHIKVSYQENGRKQERIFGFGPDITCRLAVEQPCKPIGTAEWKLLSGVKVKQALELRTKTPSYFEALPCTKLEPSRSSIRESTILRGPSSPLDPHRFLSFFRTASDEQFVSKFQKGNIYLSALILNSDNKILLSPHGIPPTVLVSNGGGLANYFNFDTDSADFAWMFKTTLDWAAEPCSSSSTPSSSPELKEPIRSTPASRKSSLAGSKRVSISYGNGNQSAPPSNVSQTTTTSSTSSNGTNTAATTMSSVSADKSSITSDATRQPSSIYEYVDRKKDYRRENVLRQEYVAAVGQLQRKLGIPPIDLLYDRVVDLLQVGAKSIMAIQYVKDEHKDHVAADLLQMGSFRWRSMDSVSSTVYTRKEEVWSQIANYYDNIRVSKPSPGLYIGLYYTESTMSGLKILIPKHRRTFVPIVKLRDKASLSQEEWEWMKSTVGMDLNILAKNCAVSKEDPMHHLKVEFAHSTAKLSRLTQLKWNPSDMYTLDTMQVVMQNPKYKTTALKGPRTSQDTRSSISEQHISLPSKLSPAPASLASPLPQSLAAMNLDPVWKDHPLDGEVEDCATFRVIMFIRPTRHATQPQEHFNQQLFEVCPFSIFDALHHSVFNTATYHQLRKSMLHLTNEIVDLEMELELDQEMSEQNGVLGEEIGTNEEGNKGQKEESSKAEGHDLMGSLLIDELGIKDSSPHYLHTHQYPRLRSSFIGDEAIHGSLYNQRSASNSLIKVVEQLTPSRSSVDSLATASSSSEDEFSNRVPEDHAADNTISETDSDKDRAIVPMSRATEDSKNEEETLSFIDMMVFDPLSNWSPVPSNKHDHLSCNSIQSVLSDDGSHDNTNGLQDKDERHYDYRYNGRRRVESGPLPFLPQSPCHRRSHSHMHSTELGVSPSQQMERSRTTSHSSSINPRSRARTTSHGSSILQHHQLLRQHLQQPVYRNRYLTHKNYPSYARHTLNLTKDAQNTLLYDCPPEIERLEKQQQELQEQWRMVSWTRQLNEWDHARMLKSQEGLLGMGIGIGILAPLQSNSVSSSLRSA